MKYYIVADILVEDDAVYARHKAGAETAVARYGGRYLARTDEAEILEGECFARRIVIIEFPDEASARGFHSSQEYVGPRSIRRASARATLRLVPQWQEP